MKMPRKEKRKIKINTTALPDIIFMLLFFFMMTTVMQNQNIQELSLPEAYNINSKSKATAGDIEIYLGHVGSDDFITVNNEKANFGEYKALLRQEINTNRSRGIYIEQAILYIDGNMPMSFVNQVKKELQVQNILKVNYIHRLDTES